MHLEFKLDHGLSVKREMPPLDACILTFYRAF